MFIGHYGVSFAAKRCTPRTSLGVLFLAVQLLDVLFTIFVLMGVEKLRIVPGFTEYNAYDLYYMPYSHSLAGSLGWSAAAGLLVMLLGDRRAAPWIAVAVETADPLGVEDEKRRSANLAIARQLGAEVVLTSGMHVGEALLE